MRFKSASVKSLDESDISAVSKVWHEFKKTGLFELRPQIGEQGSQVFHSDWLD